MTDHAITGQPMLTQQQVADYFGVTPRAIRQWTQQGRLPYVRPGTGERTVRYLVADVEAYVAARRVPATR